MNALSELSRLPSSREEQHRFVDMAIGELLHGEVDLMKFWIQASILADTLNEIKESKLVKRMIIEEAAKYKGQEYMGCKISVVDRKNFDFTSCSYSKYDALIKKQAELKEEIKKVEGFLKGITGNIVDAETGEEIKPPSFTTSTYVTVK